MKSVKSIWLIITAFLLFVLTTSSVAMASPASDWSGRPVEYWTTDNFTYHSVGFDNDAQSQNLLLYVDMNPDTVPDHEGHQGNYSVLQPSGYTITVNNHTYNLDLRNISDKQYGPKNKSYQIGIGVWDSNAGKYRTYDNAGEMYVDGDGHQSCLVKIPYEAFGNDINGSSEMTLTNSNLGGSSKITVSGASTGPYIPVAIGFVIASIFVFVFYRKKRKSNIETA